MKKTFALALCALLLAVGAAVPVAMAQDNQTQQQSPSAAPSVNAPSNPAQDATPKAPEAQAPNAKVDVDIRSDKSDKSDNAAASPRTTEVQRTGFFGLSPTAAIIVSVAVLLVVILAIVAMTNNRGNTYVERD
jgi:cytoskeletal protein RodZ